MSSDPGREIITCRLLILQSKRLMLRSAQRQSDATGLESARERVEKLQMETGTAQHLYRSAMLKFGSPQHADYWIVAYTRLIDMGRLVTTKLRDAQLVLPPLDRYQASADVEVLEEIMDHWSRSMREAMTRSVA